MAAAVPGVPGLRVELREEQRGLLLQTRLKYNNRTYKVFVYTTDGERLPNWCTGPQTEQKNKVRQLEHLLNAHAADYHQRRRAADAAFAFPPVAGISSAGVEVDGDEVNTHDFNIDDGIIRRVDEIYQRTPRKMDSFNRLLASANPGDPNFVSAQQLYDHIVSDAPAAPEEDDRPDDAAAPAGEPAAAPHADAPPAEDDPADNPLLAAPPAARPVDGDAPLADDDGAGDAALLQDDAPVDPRSRSAAAAAAAAAPRSLTPLATAGSQSPRAGAERGHPSRAASSTPPSSPVSGPLADPLAAQEKPPTAPFGRPLVRNRRKATSSHQPLPGPMSDRAANGAIPDAATTPRARPAPMPRRAANGAGGALPDAAATPRALPKSSPLTVNMPPALAPGQRRSGSPLSQDSRSSSELSTDAPRSLLSREEAVQSFNYFGPPSSGTPPRGPAGPSAPSAPVPGDRSVPFTGVTIDPMTTAAPGHSVAHGRRPPVRAVSPTDTPRGRPQPAAFGSSWATTPIAVKKAAVQAIIPKIKANAELCNKINLDAADAHKIDLKPLEKQILLWIIENDTLRPNGGKKFWEMLETLIEINFTPVK